MDGTPTTFWGKLRRNDEGHVIAWHRLIDHCADVAAVAETLLALPGWRHPLARIAGLDDLDGTTRARLCVLAALHDIGKLNLGFQAKGRPELEPTAGHVREALGALWQEILRTRLTPLADWGDGVTGLLQASICHHGRPYHWEHEALYQRSWWVAREGLDPGAGADALLAACRQWHADAFTAAGPPLPDSPAFEHAFAGLIMLADWIGSDEEYFPYARPDDPDRMTVARGRARAIAQAMWLDIDPRARADGTGRDPFARLVPPDYRPRPVQSAVRRLPDAPAGSIVVLESETGSGKTEAALAHFVRLFSAGVVDGLYFALPTRTSATQMFARVRAALQRAYRSPPPAVLAVPGYLRVDDAEGRRLAPFDVQWPDHDRFRYRGWAAEGPKRFLAGCVVVGTIDQVLLSSLMVGHAHMRAAALLRHLLVVDEVHASDAYMTRILEDVLGRHRDACGHALLLSATLGSETRLRLLHPNPNDDPTSPPLTETTSLAYPLIQWRHDSDPVHSMPVENTSRHRSIAVATEPWLETHDAVARHALDAARAGAKVLVIKNTVRDCLETQLALERHCASSDGALLFTCAGAITLHHSRFARPDREALDLALERRFGKERDDGGGVVIATQTVQQSLDLDADLLLTDLCPADVLLQRMGRLHRHDRAHRPAPFASPHTIVIVPEHRDLGRLLDARGQPRHHHGLGSVYDDLRILEATWRLVEQHPAWVVPTMNRELVEHSVHTDALGAISEDGGDAWRAHAQHAIGGTRAQSRQADLNLVDRTVPYTDRSFPSALDQRILTRLGEGDRQVRFSPPVSGPFGMAVTQLAIRATWARDVPDDTEAVVTAAADGVVCFQFGDQAFRYDRLGLRPEAADDQ